MYDAMISYARADVSFVRKLVKQLEKQDKKIWIDLEGIFYGEEWWERITMAIESSDNFLFIISPGSIASKYCLKEIQHASSRNKHILPIFFKSPYKDQKIPEELNMKQRVDFEKLQDIDQIVAAIHNFLEENPKWKRYHSRLLERAGEWKRYGRSSSLLTGDDLSEAKSWLKQRNEHSRPTELEQEFVNASDQLSKSTSKLQADIVMNQVLRSENLDPELGLALTMAAASEYAITSKINQALSKFLPHVKTVHCLRNHKTDSYDRAVHSVDYSGNMQLVATAGGDGTVRVWDAQTFEEKLSYSKHESNRDGQPWAIMVARWSPDSRYIASGGKDGCVRIWEAHTGTDLQIYQIHQHWVNVLAWSPNGQFIASAGRDGRLIIWSTVDVKAHKIFKFKYYAAVRALSWSPDGQLLAATSDTGYYRVIDVANKKILFTKRLSHEDAIISVDWHPHSDKILTYINSLKNLETKVHVFEGANPEAKRTFTLAGELARTVKWSGDGTRFALGTMSGKIFICPMSEVEETWLFVGHSSELTDIQWSDNDEFIYTSDEDSEVRIWSLEDEQQFQVFYRHEKQVGDLSISPDKSTLLSGGYDGNLIAFDLKRNVEVSRVKAYPRNHVHKISWSPDRKRVLTGCDCRIARFWQTSNWEKKKDLKGEDGWIEGLAWSPDGKYFAIGDVKIRVYARGDEADVPPLAIMEGHGDALSHIAWSPDGRYLASIGLDLQLILWDMQKFSLLWKLMAHEDKPFDVDWSPDSKHLVTCGKDELVKIWSVQGEKEVNSYSDHHAMVWRSKWSPNGKFIASSADKSIRVWDPFTGETRLSTNSSNGSVEAVQWSPESDLLYTGHSDGTVTRRRVHLDPQYLLELAKSRVVRSLSSTERSDFGLPQKFV